MFANLPVLIHGKHDDHTLGGNIKVPSRSAANGSDPRDLPVRLRLGTGCGGHLATDAFDLIDACWYPPLCCPRLFDHAVCLLVQIDGAAPRCPTDTVTFYIDSHSRKATKVLTVGLHSIKRQNLDVIALMKTQEDAAVHELPVARPLAAIPVTAVSGAPRLCALRCSADCLVTSRP